MTLIILNLIILQKHQIHQHIHQFNSQKDQIHQFLKQLRPSFTVIRLLFPTILNDHNRSHNHRKSHHQFHEKHNILH